LDVTPASTPQATAFPTGTTAAKPSSVPNTPTRVSTVTITPTESVTYSEAELESIAEELRENLPDLVKSLGSVEMPGTRPDNAPNFFYFDEGDPNMVRLYDLTQKMLVLISAKAWDKIRTIDVQPYYLQGQYDGNTPRALNFEANLSLTMEDVKQMQEDGIILGFNGVTVGNDIETPMTDILDGIKPVADVYVNGVKDDSLGAKYFDSVVGLVLGLSKDSWLKYATRKAKGVYHFFQIIVKRNKQLTFKTLQEFNGIFVGIGTNTARIDYFSGTQHDGFWGSQCYVDDTSWL
jgi:hypothetical protein